MEKMAAEPLTPEMIGEVYNEFDDEKRAWVWAMVVEGVAGAKLGGCLDNITVARDHAEKIDEEFHNDVGKALAEVVQAVAKVSKHDKA